jgi:hypothetical protein
VAAIVVLSAFLGGVTYDSYTTATTDADIRAEAAAVVADTPEFRLLDVQVEHTNTILFQQPRAVVVTVGVPPGRTASGLSARIDDRVDATAGRDVRTQVRYVETEVA